MFYCSYPRISSNILKKCEWFDLYMGAKEAIPPNMSEVWGQEVSISMFVDAYLAGYKSTKCIQIGVLIVINKDPIHWYINS